MLPSTLFTHPPTSVKGMYGEIHNLNAFVNVRELAEPRLSFGSATTIAIGYIILTGNLVVELVANDMYFVDT